MNREESLLAERKRFVEALKKEKAAWQGKYESGCPTAEYIRSISPLSEALDRCLLDLIAERDRRRQSGGFSRDHIWLWGGPTPYWGGTLEKDAAMKGAAYFGLNNVVYVYGPVDEEAMEIHRACRKLICQLTQINRVAGAQPESNAENARKLSRLSCTYPAVTGGIIDDLVGNYGRAVTHDEMREVYEALKEYNADLKLYAVIYAHELEHENIPELSPWIDCVNLWVWEKNDLPDLDLIVTKCLATFPGKPIMLGVYMHDYGTSELMMPCDLLEFQMKKAKEYMEEGKVQDLVILGDREIPKWTAAAATVKRFLDAHC